MYKPKDTYFYRAKREGYPARSVYKLEEIDRKYRLVKKGAKILDLGASPGSWLKYCLKKIGEKGRIVAVDLEEPSLALPPQVEFIKGDILTMSLRGAAFSREQKCGGTQQSNSFDLVLSDLAPRTSGIKEVDQARSLELAQRAIEVGKEVLKGGGNILVKVFESGDVHNLRKGLSSIFSKVALERPAAIRKGSSEIYLVGLRLTSKNGYGRINAFVKE